jgi:uncharacterized membrane protein
MSDPTRGIPEEQLLYARILAAGMYTGLAVLLVTFALYASGIVEPAVPIARLPEYWTLQVDVYLETVNAEYLHREHGLTGWWWLSALGHGDFLNFTGIVLLATVTLVCFVGIIPTLLRKHDWVYAGIAVIEVLILALAASGILTTGGH